MLKVLKAKGKKENIKVKTICADMKNFKLKEKFNGTLKREFLRTGNFNPDPVLFNKELTEWLISYTFVRPHQALGYDTPWQFYQKTAKVLPMYSSSARSDSSSCAHM